jgi:tRNA A-37 threonylcarbamoyl transferase component Bud32
MSQARSASLSAELEEQIDHTCDRFDALWRAGQRPRVEEFLDGCAAEALPWLLRELLLIELEYRHKAGETPTRDEYRGRFAGHDEVLDTLFPGALSNPGLGETVAFLGGRTARQPGTAEVPGYEVLGELGRGAMGVVYKARQMGLNRFVALKMIRSGELASAGERERFLAEAEAVAHLQHPNIVAVHEVGEHQGLPFFSLELCEGGNLAERLKVSLLTPNEAATLVETLARALAHAHDRGIVHRDLKPANVLRAADGTWKVTDFGLAKRLDAPGHTETGAFLGTPAYAAPEQARGQNPEVGPAADIYALGVLLYECLTGRPPFNDPDLMETLRQVSDAEPVSPRQLQPRVPRDLETICLKCLRKEPGKRYASATELADDLGRFQRGEPVRARPVSLLSRAGKWAWKRPAVSLLLFGLLVVSLTGAGAVFWQAAQNRRDREVADERLDLARRHLMTSYLLRVGAMYQRDPIGAEEVLFDEAVCPPDLRDFSWNF